MLVINTSSYGGVQTSTIVEDGWRFVKVGWAGAWTATHVPLAAIDTQTGDLDAARRVAREQAPDLFPAPVESAVRYTIEPPRRMSTAGQHRQGENR